VVNALLTGIVQIPMFSSLRIWPIPLQLLLSELKETWEPLWATLQSLFRDQLSIILKKPLDIVAPTCLYVVLAAAAWMPGVEKSITKRFTSKPLPKDVVDDDTEPVLETETVAALGSSSASRLQLQSQAGIAQILDRWQLMQSTTDMTVGERLNKFNSRKVSIRRGCYFIASLVTLSLPFLAHLYLPVSRTIYVEELVCVSVLLFYTFTLNNLAILRTIAVSETAPAVYLFLNQLGRSAKEFVKLQTSPQTDLQATAAASPVKGIQVDNLWAAHSLRRAWAVQGASFQCRCGEVLLVLGEEGSGKSRLLTAISEIQMSVPKKARSTIPVKGNVSVGGLNVQKWESDLLRSRLGVILTDVCSTSNAAKLYSGLTIEEILDPTNGGGGNNAVGAYHRGRDSKKEKDAIMVALKMVGLQDSLLSRLPGKLSTVVTALEEDLIPSQLRPQSHPLSPAEWNKLILAKVLAQLIYLNSNPMASSDRPEKSMIGNVLLLDDIMNHMDEIDESSLIKALRQSGAAVIMTSNRWAVGRFVDKIVVMKEGKIVESGTHNELLSKGPLQSVYASKWQKMTSS